MTEQCKNNINRTHWFNWYEAYVDGQNPGRPLSEWVPLDSTYFVTTKECGHAECECIDTDMVSVMQWVLFKLRVL